MASCSLFWPVSAGLLALFGASMSAGALGAPIGEKSSGSTSDIEEVLLEATDPKEPGCALAVQRDGKRIYEGARGLANLENITQLQPRSAFDTGSVAKQFTAAGLLLLQQDGKISLTDDVRKYIPELPVYGRPITIDHLLTHTSGVRDIHILNYTGGWYPYDRRQWSNAEGLRTLARQKRLNFEPGTAWAYSNSNYLLATIIIERLSGMSLDAFTRKRIFEPLGMTDTRFVDDPHAIIPNFAASYASDKKAFSKAGIHSFPGPGSLTSSVGDLLTWQGALDRQKLGTAISDLLVKEAIIGNRGTGYGRGIMLLKYKGNLEIGHPGGTEGSTAMLVSYPSIHLSVAAACNTNRRSSVRLAHKVADLFLPPPPAEQAPRSTANTNTLSKYAGTFLADEGDKAVFVASPDGLTYNGLLLEQGQDAFRFREAIEVSFAGTDVVSVTNLTNGQRRKLRRLDGPLPAAADLRKIEGLYRSEEAQATYRVTATGGGLTATLVDGPDFRWDLKPLGRLNFTTNDDDVVYFAPRRGGARMENGRSSTPMKDWPTSSFERSHDESAVQGQAPSTSAWR